MEILILLAVISVGGMVWIFVGLTNDRVRQAQNELEEFEGVIDVRRKAENAKHDNPDAIDRVRNKYNSDS